MIRQENVTNHCTLHFEIMTEKQNQDNLTNKYDYDKLNCEYFMNIMEAENWDEIFSENSNFNVAYEKFIRVVNKAIHASTPVMNSFRRNKAPWATRRISKLAAKKRRKWHVYKSSLLQTDYDIFKSVLNEFSDAKNEAVLKYENNIIAGRDRNPKKYYNYISKRKKYGCNKIALKHDDCIENDDKKCADIMNEYFGSVFTRGESNIPVFEPDEPVNNMPEITITTDQVKQKLLELDIHKAAGPDGIPGSILKKFPDLFSHILTKIFKISYETGIVPKKMKTANVVPLFKKGDRMLPSNYRPVSLTPIIAKVLESIFYEHFLIHVDENNIIGTEQHGFRKNHSTNTNLFHFYNDLSMEVNNVINVKQQCC